MCACHNYRLKAPNGLDRKKIWIYTGHLPSVRAQSHAQDMAHRKHISNVIIVIELLHKVRCERSIVVNFINAGNACGILRHVLCLASTSNDLRVWGLCVYFQCAHTRIYVQRWPSSLWLYFGIGWMWMAYVTCVRVSIEPSAQFEFERDAPVDMKAASLIETKSWASTISISNRIIIIFHFI